MPHNRQKCHGPADRPPARFDVALIADVPDDRPEANDVTLASHVSLWNRLRTAAERCADAPRPPDAERLWDQARRESGVEIDESGVRSNFVELIRRRILPAAFARRALDTLGSAGAGRIALWGAGWDSPPPVSEWLGAIPPSQSFHRLAESAEVLVFPISGRKYVQAALDAAAAGAAILLRAGEHPFSDEYPRLASLAPLLRFYRGAEELRRALRAGAETSAADRSVLREAILAEHTVARRIQWMIDELRNSRETVACGSS